MMSNLDNELKIVTIICDEIRAWNKYQSTPLAGSDERGNGAEVKRDISIHAPLRGATGNSQVATAAYVISIHAPLAGSDRDRTV